MVCSCMVWFAGDVVHAGGVVYCHTIGDVVWKCGNRWKETGVSVDVGGGNLEEKLAPSSEENLIITLEGGEVLLWQQTTQPGVWASTEKP